MAFEKVTLGDGRAVLYRGDCRETLRSLPDESVHCCVTSPPYFGAVRDYGHKKQLGKETHPRDYATSLVGVFREVRRAMRKDGTLWLNLGEVYAAGGLGGGGNRGGRKSWETVAGRNGYRHAPEGYKRKDQTLSPFIVADALRRDGWFLRSTIVWRKPSSAEPLRLDRPSLSHEYVFHFSKSHESSARNPGEPWWNESVWAIRTDADGSHPAAMPSELARRCIIAGSPEGGTVLDCFGGSGTSADVAVKHDRRAVLCELNPAYFDIALRRITAALDDGLFAAPEPPQKTGCLFGEGAP